MLVKIIMCISYFALFIVLNNYKCLIVTFTFREAVFYYNKSKKLSTLLHKLVCHPEKCLVHIKFQNIPNLLKLQTTYLFVSVFVCRLVSTGTGKLVGVVGPATSAVSTKMANFLKLFKIPQVSFRIKIYFLGTVNKRLLSYSVL